MSAFIYLVVILQVEENKMFGFEDVIEEITENLSRSETSQAKKRIA